MDHCSTAEEADAGLLALGAVPDDPAELVEGADAPLPSVTPGESAIPPLNLSV